MRAGPLAALLLVVALATPSRAALSIPENEAEGGSGHMHTGPAANTPGGGSAAPSFLPGLNCL